MILYHLQGGGIFLSYVHDSSKFYRGIIFIYKKITCVFMYLSLHKASGSQGGANFELRVMINTIFVEIYKLMLHAKL
jgi:hypothetical protein